MHVVKSVLIVRGVPMKYWTLSGAFAEETIVKKSRFLACAAPVDSVPGAHAFFDSCRDEKASHNCWAYKIGDQYRFSDDGEPGGTAGKPIYAAIESLNLDDVAVIIIRYFGGIKLGTGGLMRAYGGAAAQCLRNAPRVEIVPKVEVIITTTFQFLGPVMSLIEAHEKIESEFTSNGGKLTVRVPAEQVAALREQLKNRTNGSAQVEVVEDIA